MKFLKLLTENLKENENPIPELEVIFFFKKSKCFFGSDYIRYIFYVNCLIKQKIFIYQVILNAKFK